MIGLRQNLIYASPRPSTQRASTCAWTPSESDSCLPSPRTRGEGAGAGVRGLRMYMDRSIDVDLAHGSTPNPLSGVGQNFTTDTKGNITQEEKDRQSKSVH